MPRSPTPNSSLQRRDHARGRCSCRSRRRGCTSPSTHIGSEKNRRAARLDGGPGRRRRRRASMPSVTTAGAVSGGSASTSPVTSAIRGGFCTTADRTSPAGCSHAQDPVDHEGQRRRRRPPRRRAGPSSGRRHASGSQRAAAAAGTAPTATGSDAVVDARGRRPRPPCRRRRGRRASRLRAPPGRRARRRAARCRRPAAGCAGLTSTGGRRSDPTARPATTTAAKPPATATACDRSGWVPGGVRRRQRGRAATTARPHARLAVADGSVSSAPVAVERRLGRQQRRQRVLLVVHAGHPAGEPRAPLRAGPVLLATRRASRRRTPPARPARPAPPSGRPSSRSRAARALAQGAEPRSRAPGPRRSHRTGASAVHRVDSTRTCTPKMLRQPLGRGPSCSLGEVGALSGRARPRRRRPSGPTSAGTGPRPRPAGGGTPRDGVRPRAARSSASAHSTWPVEKTE